MKNSAAHSTTLGVSLVSLADRLDKLAVKMADLIRPSAKTFSVVCTQSVRLCA
jgi:hypothetical protein